MTIMEAPFQGKGSIAVVIPAYNRGAELARALDSLVAQTDSEFEVIVCDDGSTEDIGAVVRSYANRLQVQILRIENSGGPARPRNVAAAVATAEWLSFLDSDDWWFPSRMARVRAALGDGVDLLYHPLTVCRSDGNAKGMPAHGAQLGFPLIGDDPLMHMIRFGNPLPTSGTTVRRALMANIGGFAESCDLASVEDFDAWLRLAGRGARLRFIDESLGSYWVGHDNISAFTVRQYERQRSLFARQLELLPARYQVRARSNFSYLLGSYALDLGLPGAPAYFRDVSLWLEPVRWLKARVKLYLPGVRRVTVR